MSNACILWSYPLVFRCIRRVDAKYAYLVVKDGYVPLRRREGVLRTFLPYVKYVNRRVVYESDDKLFKQYGYGWCDLLLETIDDVSSFFQTQMEEEYLLEEEYDVTAYGKIWDKNFVEKYCVKSYIKEEYKHKVLPPKHVDPCSITVTFEEECDVRKKLDDQREKLNHY